MRFYTAAVIRLLLLLLLTFIPACRPSSGAITPSSTPHPKEPAITIYFTDPTDPQSRGLRGGPDSRLADAIRSAQTSVDMAVLELDLWSVRDALLEAHRHGVTVRVVLESDYRDAPEVGALLEAGIPVLGDRREGLMHNKFTIIDREEVWTGSMNYTINDGYRNNNNLVRIRSAPLAANYLAEFDEMFEDDRFGPGSPANTPDPVIEDSNIPLEVCFAPDDQCSLRIADRLRLAQKSIHLMAFSFTSDSLGDALIERVKAGVPAAGVMEASQVRSNSGTEYERFRSAGVDLRQDGNPRNMHHKVIIIDGQTVIFGSYNFSHYAETRNDENLIIIDDADTAARFEAEFQKLMAQANP